MKIQLDLGLDLGLDLELDLVLDFLGEINGLAIESAGLPRNHWDPHPGPAEVHNGSRSSAVGHKGARTGSMVICREAIRIHGGPTGIRKGPTVASRVAVCPQKGTTWTQ